MDAFVLQHFSSQDRLRYDGDKVIISQRYIINRLIDKITLTGLSLSLSQTNQHDILKWVTKSLNTTKTNDQEAGGGF